CQETVRTVGLGDRQVRSQDTNGGRTYRSPSEFKAYKVQESLRRKATRLTTVLGGRTSRRGRIHRVLLGRAPIDIRVYPAVGHRSVSLSSLLLAACAE